MPDLKKDLGGDLDVFIKPDPRPIDVDKETVPEVKEWDANLRAKLFIEAPIKDGSMKPREWGEILTTQSGVFEVQVKMPNGTVVPVTKVELTVEKEKLGIISIRTSAGQREIPAEKEI